MSTPDEVAAERRRRLEALVPPATPTPPALLEHQAAQYDAYLTRGERDLLIGDAIKAKATEYEAKGMLTSEAMTQAASDVGAAVGTRLPEEKPTVFGAISQAAAVRRTIPGDPRQTAIDAARRRAEPPAVAGARMLGLVPQTLEEEQGSARARAETVLELGSLAAKGLDALSVGGTKVGPAVEQIRAGAGRRLSEMYPDAPQTRAERGIIAAGDAGLPLETEEGAALRFYGSLAPALVQEYALATPTGVGLRKAGGQMAGPRDIMAAVETHQQAGDDVPTALGKAFGELDFGLARLEDVLGTRPEDRSLLADSTLDERSEWSKPFFRAMHKVEQGRMLGDDLEAAAPQDDSIASQGIRKLAWGTGLAAEFLVPWEGPFMLPFKGAKAAKTAAKLPEGVDRVAAFARILQGRGSEIPDMLARSMTARAEAGERVEDLYALLPAELRATADEMLAEDGITVRRPSEARTLGGYETEQISARELAALRGPARERAAEQMRAEYGAAGPGPDAARVRAAMGDEALTLHLTDKDRALLARAAGGRAMAGRILDEPVAPGPDAARVRAAMGDEALTLHLTDKDRALLARPAGGRAMAGRILDEPVARSLASEDVRNVLGVEPRAAILRGEREARAAQIAQAGEALADVRPAVPGVIKQQAKEYLDNLAGPALAEIEKAEADLADRLLAAMGKATAAVQAKGLDRSLLNMNDYMTWAYARQVARKGLTPEEARSAGLGGLPQGGGFEKLRHLDPTQTPHAPDYRLLTSGGELVEGGDLRRVLTTMLHRQNFGDEVQFLDQRSVAKWAGFSHNPANIAKRMNRKGKAAAVGALKSDYHFASPAEKAVVDGLAAGPRGQISTDKILASIQDSTSLTGLPPEFTEMASRFFRAVFGGSPTPRHGRVRTLDAREEAIVAAVGDAMRARWSSALGTADVVQPVAGMVVSRSDYDAMKRRILSNRAGAGYVPLGSFKLGALTPGRRGRLLSWEAGGEDAARRYFARYGIELPASATDADLLQLENRVLQLEGGRSADARHAIRGTGDLSTRLLNALSRPVAAARGLSSPLSSIVLGGTGNVLQQLAPGARTVVEAGLRRMQHAGIEVRDGVREAIRRGVTPSEALHSVVMGYRPVGEIEILLVDALRSPKPASAAFVFALRKEVLARVKGDDFPNLHSNDVREVQAALSDYALVREKDMEELGRRLLSTAIDPARFDPARLTGASPLNRGQLREVWREFVVTGRLDGPVALHAVEQVWSVDAAKAAAKMDQDDRLQAFAVRLKSDDIEREVLQKLAEAGLGTADPEVVRAAQALMSGPGAARGLDPFTLSQARRLLERHGLAEGVGAIDFAHIGDMFYLPGFAAELKAAKAAGVNLKDTQARAAAQWAFGQYKHMLTAYSPGYHITNMLSILPSLIMTQGLAGTARTLSTLGRHPAMAWKLSQRLSGVEWYGLPDLAGRVHVTPDGRVFSAEELAREFQSLGLSDGRAAALYARQVANEIKRSTGLWGFASRNASNLRDAVVGVSEMLERAVRSGVALDALNRGESMESAVAAGRRALFDYADATAADRIISTWGPIFWLFHRKNMDAFWKAVADNPARVMGTLRLAAQQRRAAGDDEYQQALARDTDLSRAVLGQLDTPWSGKVRISTGSVLTPVEAALLTRVLTSVPGEFLGGAPMGEAGEATRALAGQANPLTQQGIATVADVDPSTGFRLSPSASNDIPEWMMQVPPLADHLGWAYGIERYRRKDEDYARADTYIGHRPYFYAPGGQDAAKNKRQWQAFKRTSGLGRKLDEVQSLYEMTLDPDPKYGRVVPALKLLGLHVAEAPDPGIAELRVRSTQASTLRAMVPAAEQEAR
jgi:hypothetical protein